MDIHWGYNNICITKGDKWKAAFIMKYGLFEPTVMFFGLCNSLTTFQHMMDNIFICELNGGWLLIYIDNMLIATKDNAIIHLDCL